MVILAIDPGSKLGWALAKDGRLVESGVEDFSPRRGESRGSTYMRFRRWIATAAQPMGWGTTPKGYVPDLIAYEMAHQRGGHATEVLHGFTTRIQEIAAELGIDCVAVHSATLKKRATGSGRASKQEMAIAAGIRWPGVLSKAAPPIDDNWTDALCLLALAIEDYETLSPEAPSAPP